MFCIFYEIYACLSGNEERQGILLVDPPHDPRFPPCSAMLIVFDTTWFLWDCEIINIYGSANVRRHLERPSGLNALPLLSTQEQFLSEGMAERRTPDGC